MDAALSQLLLLRLRGGVRYRLSQFASLRGALFLVAAAGIVWLILSAGLLAPGDGTGHNPFQDTNGMRAHIGDFMPLALFGACLFTVFAATGPALHFSQNEINFLFAGPFSRRSLVVYKICAYFTGAVLSAAIFVLLIPGRASTGFAAFTGSLLTLLFVQLATAAFSTCAHAFEGSPIMRARQPAIILLSALIAAAVLTVTATTDKTVFDVLAGFRHSWIGGIVLAPFAVFAQLFLAQNIFPDLIVWSACAIAINAALLAVIIRLDGRAADHALLASHRLSNRWARMRQGASFWASEKTTGRSLRRAPALGGLGPIAWRQAINAIRNSGRVILVFFVIAMLTGPLLASAGTTSAISGIVGLLYFFIAFMMPRSLVCDFRGELSSLELYKALPVAPWRICAGQLAVPVALSSAIELVMILSTLLFFDGPAAAVLIALAAFTVPSNLLLYGLENLVFLLFPTKLLPVGRADFEFIGRTLVDFIAKTIIIVAAGAAAGAAGLAALQASGHSWAWFAVASWLVLSLIGLMTVLLLAYAFRRFRVSQTIA
ncbi:MAG: putative ABC exporter domain-containing protein [Hyphomicrobiales bacterium]